MEKITINGIEYIKAKGVKKELVFKEDSNNIPFETGENYFLRCVTYHMVGKVKEIVGSFLVLEDASWIADSGRFSNAIKEGKLSEVEPVGTAFVNTNSVVDAFPWKHSLPTKQK